MFSNYMNPYHIAEIITILLVQEFPLLEGIAHLIQRFLMIMLPIIILFPFIIIAIVGWHKINIKLGFGGNQNLSLQEYEIYYCYSDLSPIEKNSLYLAAFYSVISEVAVDLFDDFYGEFGPSGDEKESWKESWGVYDQDSAIELLQQWDRGSGGKKGHRTSMNIIIDLFNKKDIDHLENMMSELYSREEYTFYKETFLSFQTTMDVVTLPYVGAWDYARTVNNARAFYNLGYIPRAVAMEYIGKAFIEAKKEYRDWKEYSCGFLLGRALWAGEFDDNMFVVYKKLMNHHESPYLSTNPFN